MAEQRDWIGQTVGEYHLLRKLGGGSFGQVYLAEHRHDHNQVALKLLQVHLSTQEDLRVFLNEARTMRLRHPHIVPLLDFGLSREDMPFLVMEYASRGTLRNLYPKGSHVPLSTVVAYANQITSALQYAHDAHVIHRDIKPENMLLRDEQTILLSDFGIATTAYSTRSIMMNAGVGGTVPYMAPEQLDGYPRPVSDQYALGIVVYEWLAGHCPFQGTAIEVSIQHALKPPPMLVDQVPGLPKEVEEVVFRALAKDPKERFESVQAFANALQQASYPTTIRKAVPAVPPEEALAPTIPPVLSSPISIGAPPSSVQEPISQSVPPVTETPVFGAMKQPNENTVPPTMTEAKASVLSEHKRSHSQGYIVLLLVVIILFVGGGTYFYSPVTPSPMQAQATAAARRDITATVSSQTITAIRLTQISAPPTSIAMHYQVNQTLQIDGTWQVAITAVRTSSGDQSTQPKPGNTFLLLDIAMKNLTSQQLTVSSRIQYTLQNTKGQSYNEASLSGVTTPDGTVQVGAELKGTLIYEVPATLHRYMLSFIISTGRTPVIWDIQD